MYRMKTNRNMKDGICQVYIPEIVSIDNSSRGLAISPTAIVVKSFSQKIQTDYISTVAMTDLNEVLL